MNFQIRNFYNRKIQEGNWGDVPMEETGFVLEKFAEEALPIVERNIRPYLGTFPPDERARAMFISRDMVKEKEQRDMQVRQQLHEAKEREAKEQKIREQDIHMRPRQIPSPREEYSSTHYNTYTPHLVSDSLRTSLLGQQPSSIQAGTIDFKMDEKARNYLEAQKQQQKAQAQLQLHQQQQAQQQQQQAQLAQQQKLQQQQKQAMQQQAMQQQATQQQRQEQPQPHQQSQPQKLQQQPQPQPQPQPQQQQDSE